ncbi:hypothetical protein BDV96DRAFT_641020 [Lophiotrema nucula]|uniref:Uncharacterized protein n=1 Tax=Lophiotrema nucula TaxID=690887 RepID=A0A6A5ZRN1_9PLEO|nr:hypothetical protein BDV96DRAFT_641020 [Lophiotrema nucula]
MSDSSPPRPIVVPKARPKPWINRPQARQETSTPDTTGSPAAAGSEKTKLTYGDLMARFERSQEKLAEIYTDKKDNARRRAIDSVLDEGITMACAGINREKNILPPVDVKQLVKEEVAKVNEKYDRIAAGTYESSEDSSEEEIPVRKNKTMGRKKDSRATRDKESSEEHAPVLKSKAIPKKTRQVHGARETPRSVDRSTTPKPLQSAPSTRLRASLSPSIAHIVQPLEEQREKYLDHIQPNTVLYYNVENLFEEVIKRIRDDADIDEAQQHIANADATLQTYLIEHPQDYSPDPLPRFGTAGVSAPTPKQMQKRARSPTDASTEPDREVKRANTAEFLPVPDLKPNATPGELFYRGVKYALKIVEEECSPILENEVKRRLAGLTRHVQRELGLQASPTGTVAQTSRNSSVNVQEQVKREKVDFGSVVEEEVQAAKLVNAPHSSRAATSPIGDQQENGLSREELEKRRAELASMPGRPIRRGSSGI